MRSGIGAFHDDAGTKNADAQKFYDQGLAYLHNFVWIEAARSFHQALRLDAQLPLAYVGLSYAFIELNKTAEARQAIATAQKLAANASDHVKRHVDARALQMAAEESPGDAAKLAAYRKALDGALAAFPGDSEFGLRRGIAESPDPADRGQGSVTSSIAYYNRVKGRMEAAVSALDFAAVHIVRPSLLLGERSERRPSEEFAQKISPWVLTESDKEGTSVIHGFIEDTNTEVLFQLQNMTEVGTRFLEETTLHVGLCGLAYRAGIFPKSDEYSWRSYDEAAVNIIEEENYWKVAGHILAFDALRNPQSGSDLYWIYVGMGGSQLEILVNQRALRGRKPRIGAFIEADIWLQGHILNETTKRNGYEGVDWTTRPADFWKHLRKPN